MLVSDSYSLGPCKYLTKWCVVGCVWLACTSILIRLTRTNHDVGKQQGLSGIEAFWEILHLNLEDGVCPRYEQMEFTRVIWIIGWSFRCHSSEKDSNLPASCKLGILHWSALAKSWQILPASVAHKYKSSTLLLACWCGFNRILTLTFHLGSNRIIVLSGSLLFSVNSLKKSNCF